MRPGPKGKNPSVELDFCCKVGVIPAIPEPKP